MAVLGMAGDHADSPGNSLIIWSFKEQFFCVMWNLLEINKSDEFHIIMLLLIKLNFDFE